MKRRRIILGQVKDVEGASWDVCDSRDTKHGFDLLFGHIQTRLGSYFGGPPRLIATQSLVDYWIKHQTHYGGFILDLPAGRTTLKRLRKRLGFNYRDDLSDWWQERLPDLQTMSAHEFAAKHSLDISMVFAMRLKLLGRWARHENWWREPEVLQILLSDLTLRETGENLGIGVSHAKRLKDRATEEYEAIPAPLPSGASSFGTPGNRRPAPGTAGIGLPACGSARHSSTHNRPGIPTACRWPEF